MRWARCANFFSFRLRNKDPAKASKPSGRRDFGRFDVLIIGGTSQREATPLAPTRKEEEKNSEMWSGGREERRAQAQAPVGAPTRKEEEKNSEIPLFWLLRQRQIRWHD